MLKEGTLAQGKLFVNGFRRNRILQNAPLYFNVSYGAPDFPDLPVESHLMGNLVPECARLPAFVYHLFTVTRVEVGHGYLGLSFAT